MEKDNNFLDGLHISKIDTPSSDYFEALANRTMHNKKTKITSLRILIWTSAAAVLILLATIPFFNSSEREVSQFSFNEITPHEAITYVGQHIDEFETELILDYIEQDAIPTTTIFDIPLIDRNDKTTDGIPSMESIDQEAILEYLLYEGIDDELDDFEL